MGNASICEILKIVVVLLPLVVSSVSSSRGRRERPSALAIYFFTFIIVS